MRFGRQHGQHFHLGAEGRIGRIGDAGGTLAAFDVHQRGARVGGRSQALLERRPPAQIDEGLTGVDPGGHVSGIGQGQASCKRIGEGETLSRFDEKPFSPRSDDDQRVAQQVGAGPPGDQLFLLQVLHPANAGRKEEIGRGPGGDLPGQGGRSGKGKPGLQALLCRRTPHQLPEDGGQAGRGVHGGRLGRGSAGGQDAEGYTDPSTAVHSGSLIHRSRTSPGKGRSARGCRCGAPGARRGETCGDNAAGRSADR